VVCRKCFNGDLFDSLTHHSRYSPIKRHSRPRCAVCGFRASSPVHNAGGGPETHLYRPAHRLNCDRAARTT
jgi:hypothetical protein